jgi:hypothetical protein
MNIDKDMNMHKEGGKVLASGGFGCVFTPALKCIGKNKRDEDKISKLMTNRHAKEEYDEIQYINTKLNKIPNYKNYFLIDDYTLCKPTKLTNNDLNNFRECSALKKEKITAKNINKSLDKLLAINMPYGGNTVENFIMNNKKYDKLIDLNNKLLELLTNGILKMNKKHIYHSDVKASNVLIMTQNDNNMKTRLIDWNLAVEYIPFKNNEFPKNWRNRPLQFNVPFSIILFTDSFVDSYSKFLSKKENKVLLSNSGSNRENLFLFMKKYFNSWMKERGQGHYKYINKIMYMLFKNDVIKIHGENYYRDDSHESDDSDDSYDNDDIKKYVETNYTIPCIINYLVDILTQFIKIKRDGSLDMRYYLDNIFIKLIDIWGFIISYLPLYELLFENYDNLTPKQNQVFNKLKYIFLNYLYESKTKVIKVDNLENDLKELNFLIEKNI